MATVLDVAKHILEQTGEMSAMKLQKLIYYSQAWALVWSEKPLFKEQIQAWANGPVVPAVYNYHRGMFSVTPEVFATHSSDNLTEEEKDTINRVVSFYGEHSAQWLSDLTHSESPWIIARGDLPPTAPSNAEISIASMHEYYSGL